MSFELSPAGGTAVVPSAGLLGELADRARRGDLPAGRRLREELSRSLGRVVRRAARAPAADTPVARWVQRAAAADPADADPACRRLTARLLDELADRLRPPSATRVADGGAEQARATAAGEGGAVTEVQEGPAPAGPGGPGVLVADDDPGARGPLAAVLRSAGFAVAEAASGAEALDRAVGADLVVLDVRLPDLDGFEVCRRLKRAAATAQTPVLMLSGYHVAPDDRTRGLEGGADAYLTKPVDAGEVVAQVRTLLRLAKAEADARAAASHWAATFEALREGVCLLDRLGRVARFNRAMAELLPGVAAGRAYAELVGPAAGPAADPVGAALAGTGRPGWDFVVAGRHVHATADLLNGPAGPAGAVVVWADVTEEVRREAERRREETLEALGRLAGGVAHDLNNLLTVVLGNASLAAEALGRESPWHGPLSAAADAAAFAGDLTGRLLAFARGGGGPAGPVDVNEAVRGAMQLLGSAVGVQIARDLRLAAELPPVKAERTELVQVVLNLCLNAKDAMPRGGTLTLATELVEAADPAAGGPPGPAVRLTVADTGVGIPEEVRGRLFEPFVTTKPAGRGTGLGLATVYRTVRRLGGWIAVASETDRGTRFDVYLPVGG